jgi:hypothetical protein
MKLAGLKKGVLAAALLGISSLPPAYAQDSGQAYSSIEMFPKLPLSKICTKDKLVGAWKLLMVYEVPAGNELSIFRRNPLQYIIFDADNRYGEFISSLRAVSMREVRSYSITQQKVLQQYVVNKYGILFFYKDGIPVDSLACFVAVSNDPPFEDGQLLLMPPENVARGRMVKVYQKMPLGLE